MFIRQRQRQAILIGPYGKENHTFTGFIGLLLMPEGKQNKKTINKIEKVSKETAENKDYTK